MTNEQKRKFQEKFDGWFPTEEQFQYGKEHYSFDREREIVFKKLDHLLSSHSLINIGIPILSLYLENLKLMISGKKKGKNYME